MQKAVFRDIQRLKELIAKQHYTDANKEEMTESLKRNQVKAPTKRPFFVNVNSWASLQQQHPQDCRGGPGRLRGLDRDG